MASISIPIVIRDGKALGLMMTSGVIPDSVKGISIYGHNMDRTPFYPCLEENLSPITGLRGNLRVYAISVFSSKSLNILTEST